MQRKWLRLRPCRTGCPVTHVCRLSCYRVSVGASFCSPVAHLGQPSGRPPVSNPARRPCLVGPAACTGPLRCVVPSAVSHSQAAGRLREREGFLPTSRRQSLDLEGALVSVRTTLRCLWRTSLMALTCAVTWGTSASPRPSAAGSACTPCPPGQATCRPQICMFMTSHT